MRRVFPWSTLGIDADSDEAAVRRAYATKLKAMDPDADHKGFERLREARDRALALARSRAAGVVEEQEPVDDWLDDEEVDAQWHAGSRDYDDEDLPVADGSTDPAVPPVPYDGVDVDVLRGDAPTVGPPVLGSATDAALSIPAPDDATDSFASPPAGLIFSPVTAQPGNVLADKPFPAEPPVLGNSTDLSDTVTPSALTRTIDGNVATSQDAIYRLLLEAYPQAWLTIDEEAVIHRHLDVILGDERMGEIGFAADMENWLATVFARSTPRSHPFVQRLADHFGWRADAGNINQPRFIALLADRALAFDFRDKVTQPSNKGYDAWIELTTPADEKSKRGKAKHVRELLVTVRHKYPVLESEFDWYRVGMYEPKPSGSGSGWGKNAGWIVIAFIGFVQVVGAIGRSGDTLTETTSADQAQTIAVQMAEFDDPARRRVTIEDVLRKVAGETNDANWLEANKPQLFERIDTNLAELKTSREALENAEPDIEAMVYRRIRGNLTTAPYSLLVSYRRAQSAMLREMAELAPRECPLLATSGALPVFAASLDATESYQRSSAAMLIAGDRDEPDGTPVGFEARTTTYEDAARRAGMSLDYWRQVYSGTAGQGRDFCIVNASIIEAAIAAPREEAERVLRDL